uniref:Ig-like domain-containing protein n=1 Tax=Macrostomum lignano TaxID=282301 RepID=A0A1I8G4L6_9PLAT
GQWHAAAPVSSPVSAVGVSSLPLELQLEDPCRASWEAFGSSDRWRPIGRGEAALTTFIRLLSESRYAVMRINMSLSSHLLFHRLGLFVSEDAQRSTSFFFLDSCSFDKAACWLSNSSGRIVSTTLVGSSRADANGIRTHKFEIKTLPGDHGKLLQCGLSTSQGPVLLEKLLLWEVKALHISALPVLVAGQLAKLSVFSDSLPEAQHRCFIERPESQRSRNLTALSTSQSKTIDSTNRILVRVRSEFGFNVSMADRNASIVCKGTAESERKETAWNGSISEISEPCETAVDLGPEKFWLAGQTKLVQVISKRCRNVSHSCWLKLNGDSPLLQKVQRGHTGLRSQHNAGQTVPMRMRNNFAVQSDSHGSSEYDYPTTEQPGSCKNEQLGKEGAYTQVLLVPLQQGPLNEGRVYVNQTENAT